MIAELRAIGVRVILDDFGCGHASLSYLRDCTFDGLKIDRSFVGSLETDPQSRAFVRAITDMSLALGIEVTAEGVETAGQLRMLKHTGLTTIQGFLLGRPLAPDAAAALIQRGERSSHY